MTNFSLPKKKGKLAATQKQCGGTISHFIFSHFLFNFDRMMPQGQLLPCVKFVHVRIPSRYEFSPQCKKKKKEEKKGNPNFYAFEIGFRRKLN